MNPSKLGPFVFAGKTALVTGGSRGIGGVISRRLAAQGAHVFINYRDDDRSAEGTEAEIKRAEGSCELVKANLLHPEAIRELFERVATRGGLDILVHNAALGSFKSVMQLRSNQWDLSLNINARALLLCAQEASKLMGAQGGKIVSISSLGSQRVVSEYGAIGVSKAALESLTRYLAVELAARRINVNAVSAGVVDSPTIRKHPRYRELHDHILAQTPAGRLGTAEDIAGVVLFLCSSLSDWICGQTIIADGGMSLTL